MTASHEVKVTTTSRLFVTRYDADCSCGFSVGSFLHRSQAAAEAEEHLDRSESLGDQVDWSTL